LKGYHTYLLESLKCPEEAEDYWDQCVSGLDTEEPERLLAANNIAQAHGISFPVCAFHAFATINDWHWIALGCEYLGILGKYTGANLRLNPEKIGRVDYSCDERVPVADRTIEIVRCPACFSVPAPAIAVLSDRMFRTPPIR
jgi:hypothetical protein